nr:hypothetical protein L203_04207 [Cryptococcus depauperatus CBS 7841]
MILGYMRDPKMRKFRALPTKYNVKPAPSYVDIDQRSDSAHSLRAKWPYVLAGVSIDSFAKLFELVKKEILIETFFKLGSRIAKKLQEDKHQKVDKRRENERVLGPKPTVAFGNMKP